MLFDYRDGSGRDGPEVMSRGFRGVLQTDAFAVYGQLKLPGAIHAGCLAHARRKFKEASEVDPSRTGLMEVLGVIAEIYQLEERPRKDGLNDEQRFHLRQARRRPVLDPLKTMIIAVRQAVPPKGLAGRARDHTLSIWSNLEGFLNHGEVEADNKPGERSMRAAALGRKNWLNFGSKAVGPRVAAILSGIESRHRLKIPAREYLLYVLFRLANGNRSEVPSLPPSSVG